MERINTKWFWLLMLILMASFTLVAASGYLERAIRANRIIFTAARLTVQGSRTMINTSVRAYHAARITYQRQIKDPEAIRDYLKSHRVRKLQIGAGDNNSVGWLNTDIEPMAEQVYLDATKQFPLPDSSFHYVFAEHMIEHVPWEGGLAMVKECYRVLAPGGKLRIVTPNLTKFMELLSGASDADAQRFIKIKLGHHGWPITPVAGAYIFNHEVRDFGHQFLYEPGSLRNTLELAGFKRITQYRVVEKTDPVFQEVELRTRDAGSNLWYMNDWESMAFEAVR
jgi:predicted SAM-dependent methyltransferase